MSSNIKSTIGLDKVIPYDLWCEYLNKRKNEQISYIEKYCSLDNSIENANFINIIKNINNIALFDLSRISYMGFLFLDKYILFNMMEIVNISRIHNDTDNIEDNKDNNDNNYSYTNNLTNKLDKFIDFVIILIVNIELSLKFHFLLLLSYLKVTDQLKFNYKNNSNNHNTSNAPETSTTTILHLNTCLNRFKRILLECKKIIKPSTWILLILKVIRNFYNIFHLDTSSDDFLITHNKFLKKVLNKTSQIDQSFDNFIISLDNYYTLSNNISNPITDSSINLYKICINFMINITKTFLELFIDAYEELILLLIDKYSENEIKRNKILEIGKSIKIFIEIEMNEIINNLLCLEII